MPSRINTHWIFSTWTLSLNGLQRQRRSYLGPQYDTISHHMPDVSGSSLSDWTDSDIVYLAFLAGVTEEKVDALANCCRAYEHGLGDWDPQ